MLPLLSEKISSFFVRSGTIKAEDKEIYSYSFEILLATLMNFLALYLIAAITGKWWETTLFILGFIPLRSLAGGYHAKTHFRCLVTLLAVFALFLAILYFLPPSWYMIFSIAGAGVSFAFVWMLSPLEDKNKPLTANEKRFFRRRSRAAILVYGTVIITGALFFPERPEALCLSSGVLAVSGSLLAAFVKGKLCSNPAARPQ